MATRVTSDILRRGLRQLRDAIREQPRIFSLAVVASAVYGTMTVGSAWVLGRVTEEVVLPALRDGRTTTAALVAAAAAIVAVAVLKSVGVIGRRYWAGVMQYRLQASYRRRVTRQYLRLPLAWHHRHPTGQLLSNANADVEAMWGPIAPLPMAMGVVVMLVVAGMAMIFTDIWMALVGFTVFPAIALINFVYQRRLSPRATRAQRLRAEVSEVAHESFDGAMVVKTLGREAAETERFAESAGRLRDANVSVGRVRGLFDPVLEALPNLGVLLVLLIGSTRIEAGSMNPGELVQTAYLFTLLAFPIRALGWVLGELPRSVVGGDRVHAVLRASGSTAYGDAALGGVGGVHLTARDLRFSYEDAYTEGGHRAGDSDLADDDERAVLPGTTVLHGVDLDVPPGRVVAVVGPTGSGKSTLMDLLVRLVDPDSGSVTLDGVDLRAMGRGEVPAIAALVHQQAFIFDDSVRENVALGRGLSDAQVWEALEVAQADEFVRALPGGLDTQLGERGTSLSGGQRQRIALARAIARRPRLLILDDATSAVDPQVEARILGKLMDAGLPSTVLVVAYRMATIAMADEVVYLDRGRIQDRGTHRRLLERSDGYRKLVTAYERAQSEREALEDLEDADGATDTAPDDEEAVA
ncbi:MAG: ATP-binding cassette domain-containing protein [Streptosporangiales bacterium]|nr:ATP-binding cassette domain-containing protein [Streptosporangiales bacterium]